MGLTAGSGRQLRLHQYAAVQRKGWGSPVYRLALGFLLLSFITAIAQDRRADFEACRKGQIEVARKASGFHGEERIKQLIDADLTRAKKEAAEGDVDECLEALEHANNLIAGKY
jgi:hypothetical protein